MKKSLRNGLIISLLLVFILILINWKFSILDLSRIRDIFLGSQQKNSSITGINKVDLFEKNKGAYQFFAVGHIYGDPKKPKETLSIPAETFKSYLPQMVELSPDMLFLLGDIVPIGQEKFFKNLEENFFSKVNFPVFNAVGNHDVEDRELYETLYGETYYSFTYSSDMFIVLDSERVPCKITSDQLEMVRKNLSDALSDKKIKNIFIMMHRALFIDNRDFVNEFGIDHSLVRPNTWLCYEGNDYRELFYDLILPAAEVKPVYWFVGDVGALDGNLSPFYEEYPNSKLTLIADGIGDSMLDVVTLVSVSRNSKVSIRFISLNEMKTMKAENYDLEYWLSLE